MTATGPQKREKHGCSACAWTSVCQEDRHGLHGCHKCGPESGKRGTQ